jgi:hypothetical protein
VNRRKSLRRFGPFLLLLAPALAGVALAAEDPRAQATALLAKLTQKPETAKLASESLAKGQAALKRADQLRASGDQTRAAMLEQTALEWAEASQLLEKTAQSEKQLSELQTRTTELETKVFRAQALVEQTVARRARAEEALRKLDEKGAKP